MACVIENFSVTGTVTKGSSQNFTLFSILDSGVSGLNHIYFFRVFVTGDLESACDYASDLIYGRVHYIDDGVIDSFIEAQIGNIIDNSYTTSLSFPNVILNITNNKDFDQYVSVQGTANGLIIT